ncbi:hypothetical protein AUJ42_01460 [Candidatus Collierbacteria bacterium CG1_02_44_10]|uniref:Uncharacterized protein n=1 Tax=Candidatus Collierbacteria bacterium CG1_02_44_10 TaxID=1805087 RepID=A0A1J4RXM1_9BACT|nr:MAG: hypothetical protein AUJ42_01460 [Candidatus Collierbacteria bacterium CG1_02_44_10]
MSLIKPNLYPLELVFVRHGESEGNVAVKAAENGDTSFFTDEFKKRHSSTWNLNPEHDAWRPITHKKYSNEELVK